MGKSTHDAGRARVASAKHAVDLIAASRGQDRPDERFVARPDGPGVQLIACSPLAGKAAAPSETRDGERI